MERTRLLIVQSDNQGTALSYRIAWGAGLRRRVGETGKAILLIAAAIVIFLLASRHAESTLVGQAWFSAVMSIVASLWVFSCLTAVLLPKDSIYIDRYRCVIPARNPYLPRLVLWSKLEEVGIVDRAPEPGKSSDFQLRLLLTSGEEYFIALGLLSSKDLNTLIDYIRKFAPHARGIANLNEIDKFHDYQRGHAPGISYTQLWESSCAAKFALTSFTPLAEGTRVQDSFVVKKQIAAGGFSAIYLVHDNAGEQFVLKESVLPPGMDEAAKAKATEHFQREAQLLAKLNHRQIARVFDHFVENGRSYMRLEYIEGTSIRDRVREQGPAHEIVVMGWLEQLAKIVAYLHSQAPPVVHRDLTPDNVMLRSDGRVVLIDFGAANEFIGSATGTLIGKHAYMAPEQIQGVAEPASDIYSLGAFAYYCVTGNDPEPIRTASPIRDGVAVSKGFDGFVQACMSLSVEGRPACGDTCSELLKTAKESATLVST